ncbi:MAG: hypothetical protein IT373_17430 [Polyangiaceae bacterium]|nr:hypothetical protein [Polyangiaceae bacterium]
MRGAACDDSEARLLGPVSRNKIRLLFGARQTGKTLDGRHEVVRHPFGG